MLDGKASSSSTASGRELENAESEEPELCLFCVCVCIGVCVCVSVFVLAFVFVLVSRPLMTPASATSLKRDTCTPGSFARSSQLELAPWPWPRVPCLLPHESPQSLVHKVWHRRQVRLCWGFDADAVLASNDEDKVSDFAGSCQADKDAAPV